MQEEPLPSFPPGPPYFEHKLKIRGVGVALRVFPMVSQFMFQTNRKISEEERAYVANYLQQEGFLDNPITGEVADTLNF